MCCDRVLAGVAYSTLFIAAMAFCASASWVYRTKPKPRLRPVSRSLTTTCLLVSDRYAREATRRDANEEHGWQRSVTTVQTRLNGIHSNMC